MAVITVNFRKKNHDVLAFAGDGLGIFKYDFRKGKNRQALWLCGLIRNGFKRFKIGPAFFTEFISSRIIRSTFRTGKIKSVSASVAKLRIRWIARMAIWAFHYCPPVAYGYAIGTQPKEKEYSKSHILYVTLCQLAWHLYFVVFIIIIAIFAAMHTLPVDR